MRELDADQAGRLARIALGHVGREFPYALVHVVTGPDDLAMPRVHHPIFFGSFDWHSCVHSHWCLARILRLRHEIAEADAIRIHFRQAFTPEKVAGELAYLERPSSGGFERPYGWAWLLELAAELRALSGAEARAWDHAMRPLSGAIVRRFLRFLPKADYPVRAGVHSNTAFALALAHDYALAASDDGFAEMIGVTARAWYAADADCQAWEPSGDDFISPALMEAELMRRTMPPAAFVAWLTAFLPGLPDGRPATLFTPARVSDRADGKIAHLDGLNLSRAWCWRGLAGAMSAGDALRIRAEVVAERHLEASLSALEADYMGEHWLASFALLALTA